jgi:uncharacterized protein (TIRG00374 family)
MGPPKRSTERMLALLGLAITSVILAVFITRLDWEAFAASFTGLRTSWALAMCPAIIVSVVLRTIRWRVVAASPASALPVFWRATVLGYVGNMLYPARAGEALRVVALCQTTAIRPGHAMASAVADRLADVFILGAFSLFMLGLEKFDVRGNNVLVASFVLSAVPIIFFVGFIRWGRQLGAPVEAVSARLPHALAVRLSHWYAQAVEQTSVFQKRSVLAIALGLTVLAMSIDYVSIWFGMQAMGWSLPPTAPVVVGLLIAMGTMIPAAPGYVGIYQVACVLGLGLYGISEPAALAYSIVLQTTILTTIAAQGLVVFMHYGRRLSDFRRLKDDMAPEKEA